MAGRLFKLNFFYLFFVIFAIILFQQCIESSEDLMSEGNFVDNASALLLMLPHIVYSKTSSNCGAGAEKGALGM